jgi:hypothetical protein
MANEQQGNRSLAAHIVRGTLIALVVLVVAAVLIWWVSEWSTLYQLGTLLIIGGILAMLLGIFAVSGGMRSTRSFEYQQAESASYASGHNRALESKQNLAEVYSFLIIMGAAGLISIIAGALLRAIS